MRLWPWVAVLLMMMPWLQSHKHSPALDVLRKGEVAPGLPHFSPAERIHVAEEISDVLLYLVCGGVMDLDEASSQLPAIKKMAA